jgi:hypothetical protein
LVVALVEQCEPVISSAVTKLGHDSLEVLRGLSARFIEGFGARQKTPRRKTQDEKVKGRGGRCLNHLQYQEIPYPSRYEPDHHGYRA